MLLVLVSEVLDRLPSGCYPSRAGWAAVVRSLSPLDRNPSVKRSLSDRNYPVRSRIGPMGTLYDLFPKDPAMQLCDSRALQDATLQQTIPARFTPMQDINCGCMPPAIQVGCGPNPGIECMCSSANGADAAEQGS